jgi:alginate O-acetyltransferase complex protein AlgI
MLFNSFEFIFGFLPLVVVVYYFLAQSRYPKSAQLWLFAASLFFYGWWNPMFVLLIAASILVNFYLGNLLQHKHPKWLYVIGLVFNLGLLFYFKYANFFLENLSWLSGGSFDAIQVILPLGISFFTFQQIAFLSDCRNGVAKTYNPVNYGVFVAFFPQLVAGPIVHHKEMMPQFGNPKLMQVNYENLAKGTLIFMMGLAKKVVIADTFGLVANAGYAATASLGTAEAWFTSLAYSFQLYFDFSGYSDMAIGLGLFFNIQLPINFNSPYKASSIQDFWRRWHITLSRFLRDYLYIPFGGNRLGEWRTHRNLFLTFLIGGIWHGAGWTFVVWGALHGFALMVHRLWKNLGGHLPHVVGVLVTFLFVNVTWVFFRAPSLADAKTVLTAMFSPTTAAQSFHLVSNFYDAPFWLLGVLLLFRKNVQEIASRYQPNWKFATVVIGLFLLNLLFLNSTLKQDFLYFDF